MTFIANALTEYGRALATYEGRGVIQNRMGDKFACTFAACQLPNGRILLGCDFDPDSERAVFGQAESFSGTTEDGVKLRTERPLFEIDFLAQPPNRPGCWAVYSLTDLAAFREGQSSLVTRSYLLTNLVLDIGTHQEEKMALDLRDVTGEVTLSPISRYPQAVQSLRIFRDPVPTARLDVNTTNDPRRLADDLCYIISAARGTKVNWIQEEKLDSEGRTLHLLFVSRITKPFTPWPAVDAYRVQRLKFFIEAVYPAYTANRDLFRLNRGSIDGFLDAKLEDDYLETRGAKIAVAVESLVSVVLKAIAPDKEYILSPADYGALISPMARSLSDTLGGLGVHRDVRNALVNESKLRGLNRRPFANRLRNIRRRFHVDISEDDLQLFVACRNSLLHRGLFYVDTASDDERQRIPPRPNKSREFAFMVDVADRFLLTILNYNGPRLFKDADPTDWRVVP